MAGRDLFAEESIAPKGRDLFADEPAKPAYTPPPPGVDYYDTPEGMAATGSKPGLVLPTKGEHPAKKYTMPSNFDVAVNAANKGIMGVGDMIGNAGVNTVNLLTAGGGLIAHKAGLIDEPPELLEAPNMFRKGGEAIGVIDPAFEPQTAGQRVLDTGMQGVTGGLLTGGSGGIGAALTSALAGGIGGAASQGATEAGAPAAVSIPIGMLAGAGTAASVNRLSGATKNVALQQQNQQLDDAFKNARDAGFVIPASQSNPNSLVANALDIVAGGRPKLQQSSSLKNQAKVNEIARKELGLSPDTPISLDVLKVIREDAAQQGYSPVRNAGTITVRPEYDVALDKLTEQTRKAQAGFAGYDDSGLVKTVNSLRTKEFDADSGVSMSRQLREDASKAYASGDKTLGKALKGASDAIEQEIEAHLIKIGNKGGLKDFREARKTMAKTFSVEKALNDATGNVSATQLGKELKKGAPLSGGLKDIAKAGRLPGASLADTKYATPAGSQLDAAVAGGGALLGNVAMLGLPLARAGLRETLLTRPVSNYLGTPNYNSFGFTQGNRNALISGAAMDAERKDEQ
jgi:hypothetical protein